MYKALLYALLAAFSSIPFAAELEGGCMTSRRDFLRGGLGLSAIIASGESPAIVRSMVAARQSIAAGRKAYTARSYVQDGLIAMWNGIENAGWGVHDPNATKWVDLCGFIGDMALDEYSTFGPDCLNLSQQTKRIEGTVSNPSKLINMVHCRDGYTGWTLECLLKLDTSIMPNRQEAALFSTTNNGIFCLQPYFAINQHPTYASSKFELRLSGRSGTWSTDYIRINNGSKFRVSFVYNGETVTMRVGRTYTKEVAANVGTSHMDTSFWESIGMSCFKGTFAGPIYNFKFYSRALSADEIAKNLEIDMARFNLP